jgi:GT2 family glycosyltransferase
MTVTARATEDAVLSQWAVVIPAHNGAELTERCLTALRSVAPRNARLYFVDDGSTDDTQRVVSAAWPGARILSGDGTLWWTGSVELGARAAVEAGHRRILTLNNDNVAFSASLFDDLGAAIDAGASCAGAVVLYAEGPECERQVLQAGGRLDWRGRGISMVGHGEPYRPSGTIERRDWLPGCALAFSSETYTRIGGFAPSRFPQYRGDIDFTLRAARHVGSCVVVNSVWVVNDRSQTGLTFGSESSLRDFVRGLTSLKSNYNLRETVGFAWRYCPRWLLPWYLLQFYGRNFYAYLKTWQRRPRAAAV